MKLNRQATGFLLVGVSAIGFGLMGIFAKYAYAAGISVGTLLAYRFLLAGLLFWIWIGITRTAYKTTLKDKLILTIMGAGGYGLMAALLFSSFYLIPASLAEMIFYTYPILVCLLSRIWDREKITRKRAFTLGICSLGTLLEFGPSVTHAQIAGQIFAFGAALVYSLFIIYSNRLMKRINPLISSAHVTTTAGLALLGLAAAKGDLQWVAAGDVWALLSGIAVCSTFAAILAFFAGIKLIGSTRASIISTLEPLTTLLLSAVLFHEYLQSLQWTGVVLVLSALVLMDMPGRRFSFDLTNRKIHSIVAIWKKPIKKIS